LAILDAMPTVNQLMPELSVEAIEEMKPLKDQQYRDGGYYLGVDE
jgi:hypothetical protein